MVIRRALLNFALPDSCLHCHAPLLSGEPCLCPPCRSGLRLDPGLLTLTSLEDHPRTRLPMSADGPDAPATAVYAAPYDGAAATLIRALKFADRPDAAALLGSLTAKLLGMLLTRPERERALLVPLPLHRTRRRERGYDQTRLLAEEMAGTDGYRVARHLLRRIRPTRPQTRLTRPQRLSNVRNVFRVIGVPHPDALCILVDDVVTTGATLAAARAALEQAGAVVRLAVAATGPKGHDRSSEAPR